MGRPTTAILAWRSAVRRRRLLAWNLAVPLLLLAPVALSSAAAPHRVAVFGVFLVFFGTFGSAIPAVAEAREGWLDTVFRAGVGRPRWLAETVAAAAALDLLQLLPVITLLTVVAAGATPSALAGLAGALLLALVVANTVGLAIAAAVRSLAEAALASAAVALALLHLAGFFRDPGAEWARAAARINPYRPLREALAAVEGGASGPAGDWLPAASAAAVIVAIAAVTAPVWTRRFEWPHCE